MKSEPIETQRWRSQGEQGHFTVDYRYGPKGWGWYSFRLDSRGAAKRNAPRPQTQGSLVTEYRWWEGMRTALEAKRALRKCR